MMCILEKYDIQVTISVKEKQNKVDLGVDLVEFLNTNKYAKHLLHNIIKNMPFIFAPSEVAQ